MQAHFWNFEKKHKFTSKIIINLKIGIANNFSLFFFYTFLCVYVYTH